MSTSADSESAQTQSLAVCRLRNSQKLLEEEQVVSLGEGDTRGFVENHEDDSTRDHGYHLTEYMFSIPGLRRTTQLSKMQIQTSMRALS